MTIQHRIPNPVNPIWVALSVVALGGMAVWYYQSQKEEGENGESPEPDAEVIPPSGWNQDPNTGGDLHTLMDGELYTAVFTAPLTATGEIPPYAVEYIPPNAFTVHDVQYTIGHVNGEPSHAEGKIFFTPHKIGGQTTAALIRATAPETAGTFRQLHLEIE